MRLVVLHFVAAAAMAGCGTRSRAIAIAATHADSATAAIITPALLERHIRELSSARYEGRGPGTRGETLTVQYIEREFRRLGLAPGNPDGTYRQRFDLYHQRHRVARGRLMPRNAPSIALEEPRDMGLEVIARVPRLTIDSAEIVFIGRGTVAPELQWDDYKGVDVRGKFVAYLGGGPAIAAEDSATLAARGAVVPSYYAHVRYKNQLASERGAIGAITLTFNPDAFSAGAARSYARGTYNLDGDPFPTLLVVLSPQASLALLKSASLDSASVASATRRPDFRPVTLGAVSFDVEPEWRRIPTQNVVARLDGSDPALARQYVVVTAHWDAYGIGTAHRVGRATGPDSVNYGAADNAAGTAGLIAAAQAMTSARSRPRRTVIFVATSAEERSLAGARHYARHPLYPHERTVAAVNLDLYGIPAGRARDVVIFGEGRSTLDDVVHDVVRAQGRQVSPDPVLQQGIYFRMDHLPFAEVGVPAVSLMPGFDLIDRPPGYAREILDEWVRNRYHAPGDTVYAAWDFEGLALDIRTSTLVALRLARDARGPEWKPAAEFHERRRTMLTRAPQR